MTQRIIVRGLGSGPAGPTGPGGSDAGTAAFVNDAGGATRAALDGLYPPISSVTAAQATANAAVGIAIVLGA